mmetsp:Transcript_17815/g.30199  ORF Transcript_17815/g.30199 Transcript_17815/m.30199 type:complete len:160 (+) Transcript_17815:27-506(+)
MENPLEKDEMFRLTTLKMANWSLASKMPQELLKTAGGAASAQMGTKNKKDKKDKPNPCQPSKKKEDKPEKVSTFVPDNTPFGEKKDCSKPMLPEYHPKSVEAAWYPWWEKQGYFKADAQAVLKNPNKKKFMMVIPPPNVTGALHLGHALMLAIEDVITR